MNGGKAEKVRLRDIDAPEKGQPFTNRAKQFVSSLVFGQTVTVNGRSVDRYVRTIADVLLSGGWNLDHEVVKAGMAWGFRRYAPRDKILEQLETDAKEAKRGLWTEQNPTPPWEQR
jgi:endonuclease YncB( thermonuclease family)